MGEHHAEFDLFKGYEFSLTSLNCYGYDVLRFDEAMKLVDVSMNNPHVFDYASFEG